MCRVSSLAATRTQFSCTGLQCYDVASLSTNSVLLHTEEGSSPSCYPNLELSATSNILTSVRLCQGPQGKGGQVPDNSWQLLTTIGAASRRPLGSTHWFRAVYSAGGYQLPGILSGSPVVAPFCGRSATAVFARCLFPCLSSRIGGPKSPSPLQTNCGRH